MRAIRGLMILVLLVPLIGCIPLDVKKVKPHTALISPEKDEAFIFGRFILIDNGKQKERYRSFTDNLNLMLVHLGNPERVTVESVNEDGSFMWIVPRGYYLITRMRWCEFKGYFPFYPQLAFHIDQESKAYYLGTIRIDLSTKRSALSVKLNEFHVSVLDDYANDIQILRENLPEFSDMIKINLIVHDPRLPVTTKATRKRSQTMELLNLVLMISHNIMILQNVR